MSTMQRFVTAGSIALLVVMAGAGCQMSASNGTGLDQALADYDAGHYSMAHRRAMRAWRDASGVERDQAAYIAGLSALQHDDLEEAELRLSIAARSHDRQLAGRARAGLGMVHTQRGRSRDAGRFYAEAADLLDGDEAREARRLAKEAGYDSSDPDRVQVWRARAGDRSDDASSRQTTGRFALQIGVFSQADNAEEAVRRAREIARKSGHGPVRLVEQADARGRVFYRVQFGEFDNRHEASTARHQIGRLDLIVTPMKLSSL